MVQYVLHNATSLLISTSTKLLYPLFSVMSTHKTEEQKLKKHTSVHTNLTFIFPNQAVIAVTVQNIQSYICIYSSLQYTALNSIQR